VFWASPVGRPASALPESKEFLARKPHFAARLRLLSTPHVADLSLWQTSRPISTSYKARAISGRCQVDDASFPQLKPNDNCPVPRAT